MKSRIIGSCAENTIRLTGEDDYSGFCGAASPVLLIAEPVDLQKVVCETHE